jgi:cation diffusion facilitator CzcD-associated flavoprotein CzcO
VFKAGAIISALGQLNRPMTPKFEGQADFKGATMHSAAWDHNVDLTGKRVGVIGAAASAVQLIPEVAKVARHLTVFQRTPNYVGPRNDRPIRASEVAMLMSDPVAAMDIGARTRQLTFDTADTFFWKAFSWTPEGRAAYTEIARDHLEKQISDPDLRAKLTPNYPAGCKRFLFADNFYPALCSPHVALETHAIDALTSHGITTKNGQVHDLDVIIYATGFETTGWNWSLQIEGMGGQKLNEVWAEGPKAYLGITTAGFPNFFMLYGPHTNLGHNSITFMMEQQIGYVVQALDGLTAKSATVMEITTAAQQRFFDDLQIHLAKTVWADPSCHSWYKNDKGEITQNWGDSCTAYAQAVKDVVWTDYRVA